MTRAPWAQRVNHLGWSVLFTFKGVCTTTAIAFALLTAADGAGIEMLPHVLIWTVACIGGFCVSGGRRGTLR